MKNSQEVDIGVIASVAKQSPAPRICDKPALARRDINIMESRCASGSWGHIIISLKPGLGQGLLRRRVYPEQSRRTPRNDRIV